MVNIRALLFAAALIIGAAVPVFAQSGGPGPPPPPIPGNDCPAGQSVTGWPNYGLPFISHCGNGVSSGLINSSSVGALAVYTGTTTITGVTPGGDVTFASPNFTVTGINGVPLGATTATAGNLLIGSGSLWASHAVSGDFTLSSTGVGTLSSIVSSGSCTGCDITFDAKGRATAFASGSAITQLTGGVIASGPGSVSATLGNPGPATLGGIESIAAVTSKWINSISTSGVPNLTQPAFTDISGQATLAQLPNITGPAILGRITASSGNVSAAYTPSNGSDTVVALAHGAITSGDCAQFSDSFGSVSDAGIHCGTGGITQLTGGVIAGPGSGSVPATLGNPGPSTLGGIESIASVSHEWINSISTSGVPSLSQPAFSDLSGNIAASQMVALPTGDVYQGNGSNQPAAVSLSAAIDAVLGSVQGDILYRNASVWTVLAPGTNGQFLETQGASANVTWGTPSGSGSVGNCSTADALAYYATTGTTVGCLSSVGTSGQVLTSGGPGAAPSFQNATGGTTLNLGPGLGNSLSTFNGLSTLQTVTNGGTVYTQNGSVAKTGAYTLNADCNSGTNLCDTQRLVLANGSASIAITAPNPTGTLGSYQIYDEAGHGFTVPTVGGTATFLGCSSGSPTTLTVPAGFTVQLFDQGSSANAYICTLTSNTGGALASALSGTVPAANMLALPSGDVYQGNGSSQPAAVTLSAAIDAAIGAVQGDILYRNASVWTVLAPGTNGQFLETQGASANILWGTPSGSGTVSSCSTADALAYYAATGTTVGCLSGVGTNGQILTSGGTGVAPSFKTLAITLAAGLASTPGTYNPGTQTITNGSTISSQAFYKSITSSCVVNSTCTSGSDDAGYVLVPTVASVTVTLPNPGTVGSALYSFGYDGSHSYSLTTAGGTATFYGSCGAGATTFPGIAEGVTLLSDGTNYLCFPYGGGGSGITGSALGTLMVSPGPSGTATGLTATNGNFPYVVGGAWTSASLATILASPPAIGGTVPSTGNFSGLTLSGVKVPQVEQETAGWVAGGNPNNAVLVADLPYAITLTSITARIETAVGATAAVTVWSAPNGTACGSGTNLGGLTSINANGTAATNQNLTLATTSVAAGSSICLQSTGSGWATGSGAGSITVRGNPT